MSKTQYKNAARVWRAFESAVVISGKRYTLATAGEVAAVADLSVATVKKYLDMACEKGAAHKVKMNGKTVMYGYGE